MRLGRWVVAAVFAAVATFGVAAHGQSLESVVMPGKVIAGHARVEGECAKCHVRFDKAAQPRLCVECHKDVGADGQAGTGFHGRSPDAKGRECRACHTDHKGREAAIAAFDKDRFDHARTDFPLRGAHGKAGLACEACHATGKRWREAPTACVACHRKDDAHKGSLGPRCGDCHGEADWKKAEFDHGKTRFALDGRHAKATCAACHEKGWKDTPRECVACHRKDDAHKGRFGAKCETCHDAKDWGNRFAHDARTRFALGGKHRAAKCESCHKAALYREKLPTACAGCHRADDVHKGSLGDDCGKCHNDRSWKGSGFDHGRDTRFPLRFRHRDAKCESCHRPGNRDKLPTACLQCHRKDDAHKGQLGPACEKCHDERAWKPSIFDHRRDTRWPLDGGHAEVRCHHCHPKNPYEVKAKSACVDCHRAADAHEGQLGDRCGD